MRLPMRSLAAASLALVAAVPTAAADTSVAGGDPWGPCTDVATAECAWLEVPIDDSDPASATTRLRVARVRAADPDRRIGTLVTIAGGPGQRSTDWVVPGLHTPSLSDRFDIVSWDPRGTSADSLIDCIPTWNPFDGLDLTPDTDAEQRELDGRTAELAGRCRAEHGDMLPFVGTVETAHDLERLRQLLGEERISILGASYGSRVALTYATLYPDHVRAIVLDGYDDPNLPPDELQVEQAAAFEGELDRLLADCAAEETCPFGANGEPAKALDQLLADLDQEPLETTTTEGPLTQSDAYEAIGGSLVQGEVARTRLFDALAEAAAGRGAPLGRIADEVRATYESSGLTMGAFMAVDCADTAGFWSGFGPDETAALTTRVHGVAPRLGPWLWSPAQDPALPPVGLCAMQPYDVAHGIGPVDAAGAGAVLVLTTTGDPTTPRAGALRATDDLEDAVVLTLDADHHLTYHAALADRGQHLHLQEEPETGLPGQVAPSAAG